MKVYAEYEVKLPDYSLSYLINGDDSGLEDDDKKIIDHFMNDFYLEANRNKGHVVIDLDTYEDGGDYKEPYFTWDPAFGLACNVYDAHILILVNDDKETE